MMAMARTLSRRFLDHCLAAFSEAGRLWHRFWFEPADPILLGLMRILCGWMLFYTLLVWSFDLESFFSHEGLQPIHAIRKLYADQHVFSFWLWISDSWLWPAHFTCLVIAACFCLGLATRVTSILAFLITISYSQRVPVANFGLDQILGMMCLYLAVGPSGAALSLDGWIRDRWRKRRGILPEGSVIRYPSARIALRLIQLHLCAIYFWAGFAKLKGPSWWTGEAMWRVIANAEYQTIDLTWLAWVPWFPYLIAHMTILWEVFFSVLVWNRRLRPLVLAVGTAMHIGIGAFLGMWTFGLIMIFAYLSFADPDLTRRRCSRLLASVTGRKVLQNNEHALSADSAAMFTSEAPVGVLDADDAPIHRAVQQSDSSPCLAAVSSELILTTSILVVAERSADRGAVRRYLGSHGFSVRAVGNLATALEMASISRPELILSISSGFDARQLSDFCGDICDLGEIQLMVLLRPHQESLRHEILSRRGTQVLFHPASLREIRQAIAAQLAAASTSETDPAGSDPAGHP